MDTYNTGDRAWRLNIGMALGGEVLGCDEARLSCTAWPAPSEHTSERSKHLLTLL